MFGFIKRWRMNRGRAIFRFWDGSMDRAADPMVIYRALVEHPEFDWEKTPELIEIDDARIASDATRIEAAAVRQAFGVPSLAEGGLTEAECVQLLTQFTLWLGQKKSSSSPSPTLPAATEPKSSDPSTTKPGLASTSTCSDLKPAAAEACSSP